MGIGPKFSFAGSTTPGNPDAKNFRVLRAETFTGNLGAVTLAEVQYPDALNYEGRKILLYEATREQVYAAKELDPHFQEKTGPNVPIARLEPTEAGWYIGQLLAKSLVST